MMSYSQLENSIISIRRIHEIATLEAEKDPGKDGMLKPTKKDMWPQHGSIVFNDVSFKYRWVTISTFIRKNTIWL